MKQKTKVQLKEELFEKIAMPNLRRNVDVIKFVAKENRIDLIYQKEKKLMNYIGIPKGVKQIVFKRDLLEFHTSVCTGKINQKIVMVKSLMIFKINYVNMCRFFSR